MSEIRQPEFIQLEAIPAPKKRRNWQEIFTRLMENPKQAAKFDFATTGGCTSAGRSAMLCFSQNPQNVGYKLRTRTSANMLFLWVEPKAEELKGQKPKLRAAQ